MVGATMAARAARRMWYRDGRLNWVAEEDDSVEPANLHLTPLASRPPQLPPEAALLDPPEARSLAPVATAASLAPTSAAPTAAASSSAPPTRLQCGTAGAVAAAHPPSALAPAPASLPSPIAEKEPSKLSPKGSRWRNTVLQRAAHEPPPEPGAFRADTGSAQVAGRTCRGDRARRDQGRRAKIRCGGW